ncbi:DegT/DnrJ/EryC1/StrS aminotransferase family protein [[Flexibacter] sp. ATCC 35208]|uniref:DegT/DnrJ/EryC1/StrS family aminotransferase n=1 Tax=[Flexibacter] sp. ATCC 35208 TaxID=1936242 RepID=UPI0009D1E565|nr:aminotransferase class I/II-fold pyridoxal phosphate-dependent enzyme [[Flexibacter] sp. ATCC 35208]OMP78867.1 pyridoxal phosphate-dependent aminotransferase [[Flexibacter] sp. ATCC 35208]
MSTKIWLSSPHMGGEELNFVNEAFAANWIAPLGPNVDGFEVELSGITGVKHVAALSSGTSALHLALILAGVGREDEVICQSMTFSASANPIMYVGALPVFVDSEKDTWNMDPDLLEEAILDRIKKGKKTKAIIIVHLYGMPAKMDEIIAVARKYEITLIEDAAEALGSSYKGIACGAMGNFGILSFNGNKIITTSGGGALISNDEAAVKQARFLATQARDNAPHYEHSHVGYNYRMSNICAGIGRGQLKVLNERVQQRRSNKAYYSKTLGQLPGIKFLDEIPGSMSNFWLTTLVIDPTVSKGVTRENIRLALAADNIESRPLWKPMHLQPVFVGTPAYVNGTSEELFNMGLCLPSGSNLARADLERVTNIICNLFD